MKLSSSPSKAPTQRLGARLAILAALSGMPACSSNHQGTKPPSSASDAQGYNTADRYTRTVTKRDEHHPESVHTAEKAAQLEGLMNSQETAKMQGVHNKLYRQYINPDFMMHLKAKGYSSDVFPLLDMVMGQPDKFEYRSKGNGVIEIVRREPYVKPTDPKNEISADFLVVMNVKSGSISRVGKRDLRVRGKIPWVSNEKFNQDSEIYHARWKNEFNKLLAVEYRKFRAAGWATGSQKRRDEWKKHVTSALNGVSGPIKQIHLNMNVEFPKRFVDLVQSRNLDFEMNDPQVQDVIAHQATQWSTYEERANHPNSPNMTVAPDDKIKGAYKIHTSTYEFNPLRVDYDGYVLRPRPDGSWKRDPRYKEALRRKYYRDPKHQRAMVDLDPVEKKRMEDADAAAPATAARASRIHAFILRREEVDKKAYDKSTPLADLRRAAIAILNPRKSAAFNTRRAAIIGGMNRKELKEEIKATLDGDLGTLDETRNNIAARELGLPLSSF